MKSKETELDVDFIGGEAPLTLEEERAISDFINQRKRLKSKQSSNIRKPSKLEKA